MNVTRPNRHTSGFTLLELMITISIVAIFAGIGVPSFSRLIADQRVHAAAGELQAALWRTRAAAIHLNRDVTLVPATICAGWESGWVAYHPTDKTRELVHADPPQAVTVTSEISSLTYRGSGRLRGQAGTITFEISSKRDQGAQQRCLRIDPSGQPIVIREGCSG